MRSLHFRIFIGCELSSPSCTCVSLVRQQRFKSMTLSLNQLGDLLLQDPLTNVNNAALLLAAIRPDCEAVCAWHFSGPLIFNGLCIHPLSF